MLGEFVMLYLALMAFTYFVVVIICVWSIVISIYRRLLKQALISFIFGVLTTITSIISALPFLKMHGSYSDGDRWLLIGLVSINMAFMIFVISSRFKVLK